MPETYALKLYVCQTSVSSQIAEARLKALLEERLKDQYTLELVDIMRDSDRIDRDGIIASPTLIKSHPPPARRIVGDLSDTDKVMAILLDQDDIG